MKTKEILTQFNALRCASEADMNLFKQQLKHGANEPFFADGLSEYVGISSFHRVSQHYVLATIEQKGTWLISKTTLKKLSTCNRNINHDTLSIDYQKKSRFSYVIIHKDMVSIIPLLSKIDELCHTQDQVIIALDGFSASGKTTMGHLLSCIYDANIAHTDDFFKKIETDPRDPLSIYGANIDFQKINDTIIKPFTQKEDYSYQPFDFKSHQHQPKVTVSYKPVLFIEGAYSMHPKLDANYDFQVFVEVPRLKAYYRILKRNGLKRLWGFMNKWIPKEIAYVKALEIKEKANFILKR